MLRRQWRPPRIIDRRPPFIVTHGGRGGFLRAADPPCSTCCQRSENVLQSELQLAHLISGPRRKKGTTGHRIPNLPKVGSGRRVVATPARDRASQRGMIRGVEGFKPELKALPLSE